MKRLLTVALLLIAISCQPSAVDSQVRAVSSEERFRLQLHLTPPLFDSGRALDLAGVSPNERLSTGEAVAAIQRLLSALAENGYPLAVVDSATLAARESDRPLQLYLSLGQPLKVGVDSAHSAGRLRAGTLITEELLSSTAAILLDSLTDAGFPFAKVSFLPRNTKIGSENRGGLETQLDLQTASGPFERLGEIRFPSDSAVNHRGLTALQSDAKLLLLQSRLHRGDAFSRSELERVRLRLEKLPTVASTDAPRLLQSSPGILDLEIPVERRSATRASGVLSVAPHGSKPTGELTLEIGDLFGAGRTLEFSWQGLNPDRQGVNAAYTESWIAGLPISAKGELEGLQENLIGSSTTYRLGGEWEPLEGLSLGLSGAIQKVTRDSADVSGSKTTWIESQVTLDRLDDDWNPSTGYLFTAHDRSGDRVGAQGLAPLPGGSSVHQDGARVETAWRLHGPFIGYARVEQLQASGALDAEELVRLGGAKSVRGYAEELYAARGAVWGALELRWRPDRRWGYAGLFTDAGSIYRVEPTRLPDKRTLWSVGVTLGLETQAGRLNLDLGLPPGQALNSARLHFRLTGWL